MIERCFKKPSTCRRRSGGPAGPFLDGFAEALLARGYASNTRDRYLRAAAHLGRWVKRRGFAIADLDEALLARFARHRSSKRVPFQVHVFLRYLREAGVVAAPASDSRHSALATRYAGWMRDQRNLAATTVSAALPIVEALLRTVGDDPAGLDTESNRPWKWPRATLASTSTKFARGLVGTITCRSR